MIKRARPLQSYSIDIHVGVLLACNGRFLFLRQRHYLGNDDLDYFSVLEHAGASLTRWYFYREQFFFEMILADCRSNVTSDPPSKLCCGSLRIADPWFGSPTSTPVFGRVFFSCFPDSISSSGGNGRLIHSSLFWIEELDGFGASVCRGATSFRRV